MRRLALSFAVPALLAASAWATPAAAKQAPLPDAADTHFQRGTELAEKGLAPEAEVEFEKAWELRKAWDIAGNLGLVEAAQGKWEEAAEHMHYALQHIGGLATPEQKKGLQERYDNVRGRVAMVTVRANVPASVSIGTRTLSSSDAVFLSEGTHSLEIAAEGHEMQRVEVRVAKGETKEVTVELKKKAGAEPKPDEEGPPAWPAWLMGLGGGALLVAGGGLLGGAFAVRGSVADAVAGKVCSSDPECSANEDQVATANTLGGLGFAGLGLGAASLLGMTLYLVIGGDDEPSAALRVSPTGWVLEGSF
jgi:hypothetical protein